MSAERINPHLESSNLRYHFPDFESQRSFFHMFNKTAVYMFFTEPDPEILDLFPQKIEIHRECQDQVRNMFLAYSAAMADSRKVALQFSQTEDGVGLLNIEPAQEITSTMLPDYNRTKIAGFIMQGELSQYPQSRELFNRNYETAMEAIDPEFAASLDRSLRRSQSR